MNFFCQFAIEVSLTFQVIGLRWYYDENHIFPSSLYGIFENLRWLWTPPTEFLYTLPKFASYYAYQMLIIYVKNTVPFMNYKPLKL